MRLSATFRTLRNIALLGTFACASVSAVRAEPVRVYAAGNLVAALKDVIAASDLSADAVAPPIFGPAGLLRRRIEGGEKADLYLSADLAGPRRLAETGKAKDIVPFARNKLCVLARADLGLTPDNLLTACSSPTCGSRPRRPVLTTPRPCSTGLKPFTRVPRRCWRRRH